MRLLKKILATMLCVCMFVPCLGMTVFAADGRISFSDPQVALGDKVEVKCVVKSSGSKLGNVEVTISYDSESLRFDSGENVTKTANGTLVYSGSADGTEASFTMTFQAVKEGSTEVKVSGSNVSSQSGSSLSFDAGKSTVKIGPGDPSKITDDNDSTGTRKSTGQSVPVQVNGKNYTLSDTFAEVDIPNGFTETSVNYESTQCTMVMQEASQVYLAWLADADGNGEFFLFNSEDATFSPFEQVMISDATSIILLSDESLKLPEKYALTKLKLNEKEFPVWQDIDSDGYYLMYAVNSAGVKGLYRYDSEEGTYQRFELPAEAEEEKKEVSPKGFIQDFVNSHFKLAVIVTGIVFFLIFLILIVVSVKLSRRNAELDDLYDEYGIDVGADGEYVTAAKPKKNGKGSVRKSSRRVRPEDDFDEDDFDEDDFGAEDFDEDGFDTVKFDQKSFNEYNTLTALELDDYNNRDDYGIDAYADEAADDMIDDLDELLSSRTEPSGNHTKQEDSYKVDFIDLD